MFVKATKLLSYKSQFSTFLIDMIVRLLLPILHLFPIITETNFYFCFLFCTQVGDLASVQKIEKRRLKTIESVKEFQGRETALLIDRYRFLDLFPCSESELRSLGYRVSSISHQLF